MNSKAENGSLPPGWIKTTLDQLGDIYCGQSPSVSEVNQNDKGVPYVTGPEQWNGHQIERTKWTEHPRRIAPDGSIFITVKGAGIGKLFPGIHAAIGRDIYAFKPSDEVNPDFIFYALRHTIDEVVLNGKGDIPGLSKSHILDHSIGLPGTNEQRRIVAKIEELFSHLDQAARSLKTAQEQLAFHRQAVLNAAFRDIPDCKRLPSVLAEKMSNGYSGKPVKYKTDFRVLSLTATTSGNFSDQHFKYLDEEGLTNRNIWCQPNDILVQRGNTSEYVGVPAIYTGPPDAFIYPDLMIRLRPDARMIRPKYLYYALSSPRLRNYLRTRAKGSAGSMPKISQAILASLDIPYCELSEQTTIVEGIERGFSHSLSLERDVAEYRKKLARIRLSILKSAFSGKLVPPDPEDESASLLLERIKAERDAERNSNKKRKAGT